MLRLYGHWRSLATYRVNVALKLKNVPYEFVPVDLLAKAHLEEDYTRINPQGLLPALVDGARPVLFQSMAIIDYLNDVAPLPPLYPDDAYARARLKALALVIAADAHPLIVPRVRDYLRVDLGHDLAALRRWIETFGMAALQTVEQYLETDPHVGRFCYRDTPSVADIFVASHVVGMELLGFGFERFPKIKALSEACNAIDAFKAAHPLAQPGADRALLRP